MTGASDPTTAERIRFALHHLTVDNRHHEFELLALELARATVCRNVVPATGPVGAGGDQGRDFETYVTWLTGQVGPLGTEMGISDGDRVVFVCTATPDPDSARRNIRRSVGNVVREGAPPDHVVCYCVADIPVGQYHHLGDEMAHLHGVRVEVFTGAKIASLLAQADHFWIAERFLHVPGPELPDERDERTLLAFRSARARMTERIKDLAEAALDLHGDLRADPGIPLLTRPGWVPERPLPLDAVRLDYDAAATRDDFAEARERLSAYWPTRSGVPTRCYSSAVNDVDPPPSFFDGTSFRLVGVDASAPALRLVPTTYWEHFDTSESLLFQAAWQWERSSAGAIDGPYRQWLADPFDLSRRSAVPGVNVLTIRGSKEPTFYLADRRDVATAMGTVHVVPAGEFQPSRDCEPRDATEVRIEATMTREYVEELLDHPESRDPRMPPIDVAHDPPYDAVHRAVTGHGATAWYLGVGLYPLTWKPEILVACVFEPDVFDHLFARMVRTGSEGTLVLPGGATVKRRRHLLRRDRPLDGLPFEGPTVDAYARAHYVLPAARAALALAWRHRDALGLR